MSWPASAIRRTSAGCSCAIGDRQKKVARAPCWARSSSSLSVPTCRRRSARALSPAAMGMPWYQSSRSTVNACFTTVLRSLGGELREPDFEREQGPELRAVVGAPGEVLVDQARHLPRVEVLAHARARAVPRAGAERVAHVAGQLAAEPRGQRHAEAHLAAAGAARP